MHAGGHRFEPVHLHQFIGGDFDKVAKPMSEKFSFFDNCIEILIDDKTTDTGQRVLLAIPT